MTMTSDVENSKNQRLYHIFECKYPLSHLASQCQQITTYGRIC